MRAFDYIKEPEKLLTPEIVQMIGKYVMEIRG